MIKATAPAPQKSSITAQPKVAPRFGCRLLAYISPERYEGQDTFLKQALLEGGNSLLRQSQLPYSSEPDSPTEKAKPDFNGDDYFQNSIPYQVGWGFAHHSESQNYVAKASAAALDKQFREEAEALAELKPCNMLAHLRQTLHLEQGLNPNNAHPFQINDWAMVHMGAVPVDVLATMRNRLNNAHAENSAVQLPRGETDSEVVACYLALQLREQTGEDASMTIPASQLEQIFKAVIVEILLNPQKLNEQQMEQTLETGFQGAMRNSTNVFALINGQQLLISKVIPTYKAVYVGTHQQANGHTAYLISHHPMQLQLPENERIDWDLLPNDTITSFRRSPKLPISEQSDGSKPPIPEGSKTIVKKHIALPVRRNRHQEIREDAGQLDAIIQRLERLAGNVAAARRD